MRITFFAVTAIDWNSHEFTVVIQQAKDSARKIAKGVDLRLERKRYSNSCCRIENLTLKYGKLIKISESNIQKLLNSLNKDFETVFPFIENKDLKSFVKYFDATSKKYLTDTNGTIVLILNEYAKGESFLNLEINNNVVDNTLSNIDKLNNIDYSRLNDIQVGFHNQLLVALEKGTPIGWINIETGKDIKNILLKHEGIITCLREHIFVLDPPTVEEVSYVYDEVDDGTASSICFCIPIPVVKKKIQREIKKIRKVPIIPKFIQFAFQDGSISDKFPLYVLEDKKPYGQVPNIKVALISNRHFELDDIVDACIIRNSDISRRKDDSIADQERICFEIARKFFESILINTDRIHIELYHTGLEPAVIGTYRALLYCLSKEINRGRIIITPKILKGIEYVSMKDWY